MLFPDAKPNAAHKALAKLEKKGKLKAVVTQNIDGLHQAAGSETAKTDSGNGEGVTIRLVHYMGEQAKRDALDAILADSRKKIQILM